MRVIGVARAQGAGSTSTRMRHAHARPPPGRGPAGPRTPPACGASRCDAALELHDAASCSCGAPLAATRIAVVLDEPRPRTAIAASVRRRSAARRVRRSSARRSRAACATGPSAPRRWTAVAGAFCSSASSAVARASSPRTRPRLTVSSSCPALERRPACPLSWSRSRTRPRKRSRASSFRPATVESASSSPRRRERVVHGRGDQRLEVREAQHRDAAGAPRAGAAPATAGGRRHAAAGRRCGRACAHGTCLSGPAVIGSTARPNLAVRRPSRTPPPPAVRGAACIQPVPLPARSTRPMRPMILGLPHVLALPLETPAALTPGRGSRRDRRPGRRHRRPAAGGLPRPGRPAGRAVPRASAPTCAR